MARYKPCKRANNKIPTWSNNRTRGKSIKSSEKNIIFKNGKWGDELMSDLKIKYGSLAEYLIPHRPEYLTLILLRMKIMKAKNLQEVLDEVQDKIVKIESEENKKWNQNGTTYQFHMRILNHC